MNIPTLFFKESGKVCSKCYRPLSRCNCDHSKTIPSGGDGIVRVSRETKGRKGKGMTLISGLMLNNEDLEKLSRELKQKLGTGGTIKDRVIEIQGDHRDQLCEELKNRGFSVKKCGG